MERNRFPRLFAAALGILILALVLAACTAAKTDPPSSPMDVTTPIGQAVAETVQATFTAVPADTPVPAEIPTAAEIETESVVEILPEGAEEPVVLKQGIGQNQFGGTVVGILVFNPNKSLAIEQAQITVEMYAEDGALLDSASAMVDFLPEQTLGYVFFPQLPEGSAAISRVDARVTIDDARYTDPPSSPMLQAEVLPPGDMGGFLKVKVTNPTDQETKNLRIFAIAFDAAGEIIGGGDGFLDPLAAGASAEVTVLYITSGEPASFEVYAP